MATTPALERFPVFLKAPGATKNYVFNWGAWLAQELGTIIATSIIVPAGITQVSYSWTSPKATVVLSGGTEGKDYTITSRVTTSNGIIEEKSIIIRCQQT